MRCEEGSLLVANPLHQTRRRAVTGSPPHLVQDELYRTMKTFSAIAALFCPKRTSELGTRWCRQASRGPLRGWAARPGTDLLFLYSLPGAQKRRKAIPLVTACIPLYRACSTRWRSSANPARPNIIRLMSFNLLIFPSTMPLLACKVRPAKTASLSRWMLRTKRCSSGI